MDQIDCKNGMEDGQAQMTCQMDMARYRQTDISISIMKFMGLGS